MTGPLELFLVLAGPFVGGFLATFAQTWPDAGSVTAKRSLCACGARTLLWRDLAPVWNWLGTAGRCRVCPRRIPAVYPLSEAAGAATALAAAWAFDGAAAFAVCLFAWAMVFLAAMDGTRLVVPTGAGAGLAIIGVAAAGSFGGVPAAGHAAATGLGCAAILAIVAAVYRRLRGREGLGAADPGLFAAVGAWTGFPGAAWAMTLATFATLAWLAISARSRGERWDALRAAPLAPGLAFGAVCALTVLRASSW